MFTIGKLFTAPPVKIETKKSSSEPVVRTYSEFVKLVQKNRVSEVTFNPNSSIAVFLDGKTGDTGVAQVMPNQDLWKLFNEADANVTIDMSSPKAEMSMLDMISTTFMLVFLFIAIRTFLFGPLANIGSGGPLSTGNKEFDVEEEIKTRFEDVEGIDAAKGELMEIVDFLKRPDDYVSAGARIPKGCLLVGPPGTGKTLLAKAIAGESEVPFISVSGSQFVEMFFGMGAKRVRDLFALARAQQPCIVFIDEIDAIGKARGSSSFATNDEREQTINQLLTEMDGFEGSDGVVVLAATNRADILDEALLRPGRFDRKIQVALPNKDGRFRILNVHSRGKQLDTSVDLEQLARSTTGFSGADLQNIMNEAAIASVREGHGLITNKIIEDVYQRVVVGAKSDTIMSVEKRDLVAFHEAGHAIMGVLVGEYDEVRKVSIIPRGDAGGVTFFSPREDGILNTKTYYLNQIKVLLGGRAAEELVYGKDRITTGASADLRQVNALAREMVTAWGFGETYIGVDYKDMSVFSARQIDREVDKIVTGCYEEVLSVLEVHRLELEILKQELVREEIVEGSFVYGLIMNKDKFCNLT